MGARGRAGPLGRRLAALVERLVKAEFWWPHERDGEPGYGFNDWHDYNDPADAASKAGTYGNHVRWHVNESKVEPDCAHCPREPDEPEDRPDIAPDIGGRSGGESHPESGGESLNPSGAIALPEPEPEPDPNPKALLFDTSNDPVDRFDEFWDTYGKKVDRIGSEKKWRLALKKPGVSADMLIAAAAAYVQHERAENDGGRYIMGPAKWLLNERWNDERPESPSTLTRVTVPEDTEAPPDGLDDEAWMRWDSDRRRRAAEHRAELAGRDLA